MTRTPAGTVVDYRVTFLQMTARPAYDWPQMPGALNASLLRAKSPPAWYFLALYEAVGRDYAWDDQRNVPESELEAWLANPAVELWSLIHDGWPKGFFLLDARDPAETRLGYFGLVRQMIGRGLGQYLVRTAVLTAWQRPGLEKLIVNTCSLDHPRALANYQKAGFEVARQETRRRVLQRAFDPTRIPE